ncbi:MAG: hypothetical protein HY026_02205 [Deltaproteobacteria bacterium]|nr:hypothetical protein [Deltaproteobacteria bacterium]
MEFQEYIERLKTAFICEKYDAEIKKAKQEFVAVGGELGNEVEGFEDVLDIFFDWYIFDRPQIADRLTPLMSFLKNYNLSEEDRKIYLDFANNIHSIFSITKVSTNIRVKNIFTKNRYIIADAHRALLEKGDVIEARLLSFKGGYRFSGAFCFYPKNIYYIIKAKAKEARKEGVEDFTYLIRKFRKLKTVWGRCSNIDIRKVYTLMEEGLIA